jgi:hypothetical protein
LSIQDEDKKNFGIIIGNNNWCKNERRQKCGVKNAEAN